jgi:hypothetical protein
MTRVALQSSGERMALSINGIQSTEFPFGGKKTKHILVLTLKNTQKLIPDKLKI